MSTRPKRNKFLPIIGIIFILLGLYLNHQETQKNNQGGPSPQPSATASVSEKTASPTKQPESKQTPPTLDENGSYFTKEEVTDYLLAYGHLPKNFITKKQAQQLGWQGGDLRPYIKNAAIGGDRFGNFEGLLPRKSGRVYYECDIDTQNKKSRGAKRLVYSNDGLIYYTDDHYESFTQLAGGRP